MRLYRELIFLTIILLFCSCGQKKAISSNERDAEILAEVNQNEELDFLSIDENSFLKQWGQPTFTDTHNNTTYHSYYISSESARLGEDIVGITATFKEGRLFALSPIVRE